MPTWEQYTHTGVLDLDYDFGNGMVLTNQTQFSDSDAIRTTGLVNNGDADIDQQSISNETQLNFGEETDPLSGVVGLYYAT